MKTKRHRLAVSKPSPEVEPDSAPEAREPAPEPKPEAKDELKPTPTPARLHLGDGVANFSREDHFHETPGGWLECAACVRALKGE